MKNLKRLSMIAGLLILIAQVFGQNHQPKSGMHQGPPPPIPDQEQIIKMVNELSETLSLTKEQTNKLSAMFSRHFETVKGKMEENKKHREEMEALKNDFETEIKTLLNDEQKKQFDKFVKEKENHKRREEKHKRPDQNE